MNSLHRFQSPPMIPLLLLSQPSFRALPQSLWLLSLLLSTANAQSIQGFVYWDSDFNGILSEGVLDPSGTFVHELVKGVVNVRIEVKQCGSSDGESIIQGLTGWLANSMEIPGNSNIHPKAGYYKIDVSSNVNTKGRERLLQNGITGCLITNEDVEAINSNSRGDDSTKSGVRDAGCYLIVSSPKDYEITTTFQTPYHGFHGRRNASSEEMSSIVGDIFSWIPYKDIGPFTNNGGNDDTLINRGYQTRTSECFGFNKDDGGWYVWKDELSVFNHEKTETDENDHDLEEQRIGAVQIAIPNSRIYGYDRYLSQTSYNYEGVLSISPVGMAKTPWPLPLRVKSDVFLGLKFNDNGPLNGRFQFQPTSENEAVAASKLRDLSNSNMETSSSNVFSTDGADNKNENVSDNSDGILTDVSNLEDVVQSFLRDEVLKHSGDSGLEQILISLDVATVEQWSMVKITDSEASSNKIRYLRRLSNRVTPHNLLSPYNLRGSNIDNHRILRSMLTPHTVFYLQVYGTYTIRTTAEVASIIRTIEDFGKLVSSTINRKRDDLMRNIRTRTGFNGPECFRPPISTNGTNDEAISFGIGSPNKFACDDLLPLYYYHLGEVVARGVSSHNTGSSKNVHLSKALKALKEEYEFYDSNAMQEKKSFSGSSSLIYITLSVFSFLLIVSVGAGWFMYERKRRANIRQRKRILKERYALKKSSENFTEDENIRKAGIAPTDESHKSKVDANASPSNDDSELGQLFYDSLKTCSKTTDLEQSNHSGLDRHDSYKSGLDYSTSFRLSERNAFKKSQIEKSEVASTDTYDAKNKTRIIEQPTKEHANAFPRQNLGNALLSFHKSATKVMLGEVDISDSEDSSSDSHGDSSRGSTDNNIKYDKKPAKSQASPSATIPQELLPNHKRKMLTSAFRKARSSLTRSSKKPLKRNGEGDRTEPRTTTTQNKTRTTTTQNKTVTPGAQTNGACSLLTERSVPSNAESSTSLDNHLSPPDFSEELSPASTSNMCDIANESGIAMSDDQHVPIDNSPMQRMSHHVDTDSDDDSSDTSSSRSSDSDYSSSESSSDVIDLKINDRKDVELELSKNRHQSYHPATRKGSDRPTARRNSKARDRNLINCNPVPTTHKERSSSGAVKVSKSSSDRCLHYEKPFQRFQPEGFPKESIHRHKREKRISLQEPRGFGNHLQPHRNAISEPHLFSGLDVAIPETMDWLGSKTKIERHKPRPAKSKSKPELHKNVSNRERVEREASKTMKHASKSHSHLNRVQHHLKGDIELREASTNVRRGQAVNKKLLLARVESHKSDTPRSNGTAVEAHTDKPNRHKPHLHESILAKTPNYLPQGLESGTQIGQKPRPSTSRTKSSKSKSSNALDHSSKSRMNMQPTNSTLNCSRPSDSRKVSDVRSDKKKCSRKQDPPARSELRKQNGHKAALEKLNGLKSSLQSSLKGAKLSAAATSILECADVTNDKADKQEKKLKARSMKSSHSARASELSSSNLRAKSSSYKLSQDVRNKTKH